MIAARTRSSRSFIPENPTSTGPSRLRASRAAHRAHIDQPARFPIDSAVPVHDRSPHAPLEIGPSNDRADPRSTKLRASYVRIQTSLRPPVPANHLLFAICLRCREPLCLDTNRGVPSVVDRTFLKPLRETQPEPEDPALQNLGEPRRSGGDRASGTTIAHSKSGPYRLDFLSDSGDHATGEPCPIPGQIAGRQLATSPDEEKRRRADPMAFSTNREEEKNRCGVRAPWCWLTTSCADSIVAGNRRPSARPPDRTAPARSLQKEST